MTSHESKLLADVLLEEVEADPRTPKKDKKPCPLLLSLVRDAQHSGFGLIREVCAHLSVDEINRVGYELFKCDVYERDLAKAPKVITGWRIPSDDHGNIFETARGGCSRELVDILVASKYKFSPSESKLILDQKLDTGETPLDKARVLANYFCERKTPNPVPVQWDLFQKSELNGFLLKAVKSGASTERVAELIHHGAHAGARESKVLLDVFKVGSLETVQLLLENGAQPQERYRSICNHLNSFTGHLGSTQIGFMEPLHPGQIHEHSRMSKVETWMGITKEFLTHGLDPTVNNSYGFVQALAEGCFLLANQYLIHASPEDRQKMAQADNSKALYLAAITKKNSLHMQWVDGLMRLGADPAQALTYLPDGVGAIGPSSRKSLKYMASVAGQKRLDVTNKPPEVVMESDVELA